jgi:hypothetical protein
MASVDPLAFSGVVCDLQTSAYRLKELLDDIQAKLVKQHQWRLKRSYQFPNAVDTIHQERFTAWIVNLPYQKSLYGVVRYVVRGENAWVESDTHFGTDADAARKWIENTIRQLQAE